MWEGPAGHILVPAECGTKFVLSTTYTRAAVGLGYICDLKVDPIRLNVHV